MPRLPHADEFSAPTVAEAKGGRRVSVVLPARNEAATVGAVVEAIAGPLVAEVPVVDELVVVDDHSEDATAQVAAAAGARVLQAAELMPGHPGGPGKGQAMWRALAATSGDIVVFCDADLVGFDARYVLGLVGALLDDPALAMVKGCYDRPGDASAGEGGRVTELTARPAIALLHPYLAGVAQPLAGELAAHREVLEGIPFLGGYGVELGMLIDVAARWGPEAIGQCHLGQRLHRRRSLSELSAQSVAVLQVALARSKEPPAAGPWTAVMHRPGAPPVTVVTDELPPLAQLRERRRSA